MQRHDFDCVWLQQGLVPTASGAGPSQVPSQPLAPANTGAGGSSTDETPDLLAARQGMAQLHRGHRELELVRSPMHMHPFAACRLALCACTHARAAPPLPQC